MPVSRQVAGAFVSPYARWNLRRNPFGELTRGERAELAVVDVHPWGEALRRSDVALQFVGPCGHGKTTHLLAIARHLRDARYIYLPPGEPVPPLPAERPLIIDEAQRLPWRSRRAVLRLGGPLILGTHRDMRLWLRWFGFHVITVRVDADRTPEHLQQVLNRRIESSRIDERPTPTISLQECDTLRRRFGGNLRAIERHLYDEFQRLARMECHGHLYSEDRTG